MSPSFGRAEARPWPVRLYFVVLLVLGLGAATAAAMYVDVEAGREARREAHREALFSARVAAKQLGEHVALLRTTTSQLAANPQIGQILESPEGCTLTFQGMVASDASHLDILRPDGTVACSSRAITPVAARRGYGGSGWLRRGLQTPILVAPAIDDVFGGPVAISASPIPGEKGLVAGFVDVTSLGPELAARYGGGRETVFLVTTRDGTVISRSLDPTNWAGKKLSAEQRRALTTTERRDLNGTERLYADVPVPGVGWSFHVGEKKSEFLASVHRLRTRQLLLILFGLTMALLATAVVYRRVVQPIRRLSLALRKLNPIDSNAAVPVSGPAEVAALGQDVNSLIRRVQSELLERRRSERRYRDLFENATDLISAADLDGRLTTVNEAFVRTTGYSREQLIGKPVHELVPPEQRDQLQAARDRKLAGAETTVYEHDLVARDGRRIPVEVASRLIEEDGKPVGTEAIARDISERVLLEEQLRQAQRLEAVGRLAGGVAHDFNNVLTVIGGYTEALLANEDSRSEEDLEQIAAATTRAAALTRQLLAFSRQQVLEPRVLLVNDVVDGVLPMLRRLIGEDIELVTSLEPEIERVLADSGQLEQVLVNLVVNARDAMPDGGRLTIQTSVVELDEDYAAHHRDATVGPHVLLSVADEGVGMDANTLTHAFEPFYTTKPVGAGTGLGLATVYGIVKQSGGSIWVYSEPGQGTTFKIYLPTTDAPIEAQSEAPAPVAANGAETILIAEDEESLRTLTTRMLTQRGYDVITAETASEALRIAERESDRIDLLLTDLVMPEISGRALAERVGEIAPGIRVLFMSGYSDDALTRNGSLDSSAAFLEKPFTGNDLAAKVRETLTVAR